MLRRRSLLLCTPLLAAAATCPWAYAQTERFPSGPIKLVVNFPAGGNADLIGRVYARKLSEQLSTPVVVDNRGGAAGTIGADYVAKSAPDGHTLLITPYSILTNPNPGIKTTYKPQEDFVPVLPMTIAPLIVAVSAESQVTSLRQLEQFARNNRLSYGTYGPMTTTHIWQHRISTQLKARDSVAVAYRGEAPMLADLLGGQIQMGVLSQPFARENEKAGKIKLVGILGQHRSEFLPHLPTLHELGFQGVDWTDGVVVFAPARTPSQVLQRLQEASRRVLQDEDTLRALRAQPNQPWLDMTPEKLKAQMAGDVAYWDKARAELGATQ